MRTTYEIGRVMFDFDNEWSQLFGKYNWYTFRFLQVEWEWDKYCGSLEFMFALLGFGLRIAIAIPNEVSEKNRKKWALTIEESMGKSVPLDKLVADIKKPKTKKANGSRRTDKA